jgi:hypothetical protein
VRLARPAEGLSVGALGLLMSLDRSKGSQCADTFVESNWPAAELWPGICDILGLQLPKQFRHPCDGAKLLKLQ